MCVVEELSVYILRRYVKSMHVLDYSCSHYQEDAGAGDEADIFGPKTSYSRLLEATSKSARLLMKVRSYGMTLIC